MTVDSVFYLYGIKLDASIIRTLLDAGILEWNSMDDQKSMLDRFDDDNVREQIYYFDMLISTTSWELISTPHDERNGYGDDDIYYGVSLLVDFGTCTTLPTLSDDECRVFDQMLAEHLPGIQAKYEIIPLG